MVELIDFKYKLYLESVSRNQKDIINYATECACLESGNISSIAAINEAAMDSVKNAIKKIIEAISGIWKKFVERANSLITTDISYLNKYKDIITNKPPKSKDITMYDYDLEALKIPVPVFNYTDNKLKQWLTSENPKGTFLTTFIGDGKINKDTDDITEAMMERIRGKDQIDTNGSKLDMKKLYNFCINYKNTCASLQKDTEIIAKSRSEVDKTLASLAPKIKEAEEAKNKEAENKSEDTTGNTTSNAAPAAKKGLFKKAKDNTGLNADALKTEAVYSNVYNAYITEAPISVGKTDKEDNAANAKTNVKSGTSTANSAADNGIKNGMVNKTSIDSISSDVANKSQEEFNTISENAPLFFTCCGNVLSAKLTVGQEIMKSYMAIIRAHVRDYVADAE